MIIINLMERFMWVIALFTIINIYYLAYLQNGRVRHSPITAVLCFVFAIDALFVTLIPWDPFRPLFLAISFLLMFIMPFCTIEGIKKRDVLYITLLYGGANTTFTACVTWLINLSEYEFNYFAIIDILVHLIMLIFIFLFRNKLALFLKYYATLLSGKLRVLLLLFSWLSGIVIYLFACINIPEDYFKVFVALEFPTIVLLIIMAYMFPFAITNHVSNNYYRMKVAESKKQLERQVEHYELISKRNTELRRFRHDFKNLYIGLKSFFEKKDCEGALEYLNSCDFMMNTIEQLICFQTGNDIADALLSEKQQLVECSNIKILFNGHIPSVGIDPVDMCILLGNPLDNAIEACQKLDNSKQKVISIKTKLVGNMLIMDIYNPVDHDVVIINNTIASTKDDHTNHGFGIYSLQRTLRKYEGNLRFKCSNNVFVAEMSLIIT